MSKPPPPKATNTPGHIRQSRGQASERALSWQTHHATAGRAEAALAKGPGTINLCWGSAPVSSKYRLGQPSSLAQLSCQPCHTTAKVGAASELLVNSGQLTLVTSCYDYSAVAKKIRLCVRGCKKDQTFWLVNQLTHSLSEDECFSNVCCKVKISFLDDSFSTLKNICVSRN